MILMINSGTTNKRCIRGVRSSITFRNFNSRKDKERDAIKEIIW